MTSMLKKIEKLKLKLRLKKLRLKKLKLKKKKKRLYGLLTRLFEIDPVAINHRLGMDDTRLFGQNGIFLTEIR